MKQIAKKVLFAVAVSVVAVTQAGIEGATKACNPGTWTTSLDNARKVGKENHRFIVIAWGKSEGCGFCNSAAESVFNKDAFKKWSKENGIPIVWADDVTNKSFSDSIYRTYFGSGSPSFPQFLVIDPSNNDKLLLKVLFQGATAQYGTKTDIAKDIKDCPNAWYLAPSPSQTTGMVDFLLGRLNDKADAAVSVVPASKTASKLGVTGIWNNYGMRSLSCRNMWTSNTTTPKIKLMTHVSDQFDWFKFTVSAAGAYQVKLQDFVDSHNEGQLYVFKDATTAKAVTSYALAAEKAMATSPMSAIAENDGWAFSVPSAGTYYLLFTRPNSEKCKQLSSKGTEYDGYVEKTLKYTFTLQEVDAIDNVSYYFTNKLISEMAGHDKVITVLRSAKSGSGKVKFQVADIAAVTDETTAPFLANTVQGVEGQDFVFLNEDGSTNSAHEVIFAKDATNSAIRVHFNSNTNKFQALDRTFGITLDSKVDPPAGLDAWHWTSVRIYDPNIQPDPVGDVGLNADGNPDPSVAVPWVTGYLNYTTTNEVDDTEDVYFVTNVATTSSQKYGSFYYVSFRINYIHDFKDSSITVRALRSVKDDEPVVLGEKKLTPTPSSANFAVFPFGVNSPDGWLDRASETPEIVLQVTREKKGATDTVPTVSYQIQCLRFDRPLLAFDAGVSDIQLASDAIPSETNLTVHLNSIDAIIRRTAAAAYKVNTGWQTVPAAKDPADPELDYTPVTGGVCANVCDTNEISVALKPRDALSWPRRSFDVRLLPADDDAQTYLLDPNGRTNVTVTFLADNVAPSPAVTVKVPADGSWASTGDAVRNLNYTNEVDWITVTNVQNGACYRLKAEDVTARPAGAEEKVTVDVYTNGAKSVSYCLADLVMEDDAQAPVLTFEGLTNETVQLKVSRSSNDKQVRIEYRLSLREEKDAGLDAADPDDDVRSGAFAFAVNPAGDETKLARLLNGMEAAVNGVNDTNDWFRFTGIAAGETYRFAVATNLTTNVSVRAAFYRGDAATPFADLDLGALVDGYRYDAPSADDVVVRISREPSEEYALVRYELGVSHYIWPVVGFTTGEVTVTNSFMEGSVPLKVYRHFNTNRLVTVGFDAAPRADSAWARSTYLYGVDPDELDFLPGETVTNVAMGINKPIGAWVGDWTFNVTLNTDTNWCRYGAVTNVLVKVVDKDAPAKDPADSADGTSGDDVREGATALACGAGTVVVTNHLNGIDVPHEGFLLTDTNDWFKLTGLKAEKTYRLSIPWKMDNNMEGLQWTVTVEAEAFTKTVSCIELTDGRYLDVPSLTGRDVLVRVARTTSAEEKPISLAYALKVEKVDWPKFDLAAVSATVRNDAGVAQATVTRSVNAGGRDVVIVKAVDTNAVKVAEVPFTETVVFGTNETVKTVSVGLVADAGGYWKRGGDFRIVLERAAEDPYVSLGATNAVVTVTDASGVPENDYPTDDVIEGAQRYAVDVVEQSGTNHLAAGQSAVWLNGGDLADWYCLTGVKAGTRYRIGINSFGATNTVDSAPQIMIADDGTMPVGIEQEIGKDDIWSWDYTPSADGNIWVKVWRAPDATRDVSVRYVLTFRELAPAYVRFRQTEQRVSGAAAAVYADVECVIENNEPLYEEAVVTVWPREDVGALAPATPGRDFDVTPVTLTWPEGSTGGVRRVSVPIAGSSATWKGEETFLLTLSNVTDTAEVAAPENGGRQRVTVEDTAKPVYGTVGITKAGADKASLMKVTSSSVLNAREGDTVVVRVTRVGGQSGRVKGVWTWKSGKTQVGETVKLTLFDGVTARESTVKDVELTVPTTPGYQTKRTLTLNFAIETEKAKTVTVTKGTPTALKFAVTDKDYAGAISAYSAGDPAKVDFKASGSSWFLDRDGGVRAAVAAGAKQTMTASVTGPGTLTFDATVAGGCTLTVKVGGQTLKTINLSSKDEPVHVDAVGAATVSFVCASPRTLTGESCCAVSNVRFVRDDAANGYGTFTGRALIDGLPGAATLTVSTSGKISGKIICASRTWTFSAKGGWTANPFTVTLKSGKETPKDVKFLLRAATGEVVAYEESAEEPLAALARNVWGDKPLSTAAALALKACAGYLTAVMPPETDAEGPLYGSGYCGLTVSKSGVVKASGKLADGQTLSVSGTLAPAADGVLAATYLFAKPSAYKGGWYLAAPVFQLRDFGADGVKVVVSNAVEDILLEHAKPWDSEAEGKDFERTPGFVGGWYDKTENLHAHYTEGLAVAGVGAVADQTIAGKSCAATAWAADESHPVALAFNETGSRLTATCGGGDRLFTVSLTRSTGIFSGSFRATYDYTYGGRERTTTKSFAYRGMLVPYAPDDETAAGRGYFLMPVRNEQGKTVDKSYDLEIAEEED